MKKIFPLALFLIAAFTMNAQTGTIKGVVSDHITKDQIIGASAVIKGTVIGAATDIYGTFSIDKVPVGEQELIISFIAYKPDTIKVLVKANEITNISVEIKERTEMLNMFVVEDVRRTNTEAAVLMEIKEAKTIVSGVSRQQIARSQDRNAAEVMQRIPGITIVDNRFVMIRGVSSRYNAVMINNVLAPSTEVDRRTFSFDMISSGALDRMMVYKTGAPENPGDFAGGVIKLYTVNTVEEDFMNLKVDFGFRNNTTFQPYFQSEGSSTDAFGFDRSFRPLPDNFPTTRVLQGSARNAQIREDAAEMLPNNFNPTEGTALPDYGLAFSMGKVMDLKGKKLTTITSVGYSNSYQYYERDFYRYFEWEDRELPIVERFRFMDDVYQRDQKINVMSNWRITLSPRSKITFSNLFNQIGENETIIRNGEDFIQRPGDNLRNYLLGYRSRSIYTGQLEGVHDLGTDEKHHLNWVVGGSYLGEEEPDLRRFRTYQSPNQDFYTMQLPPSSNLFETGRYYGSLSEFSVNSGFNYTYDVNQSRAQKRTLKFGYYTDLRSRAFDSRYISYLYPGFFDLNRGQELSRLPLDQVFSRESISTVNGFVIEEGTRPIDAYTAQNYLNAAYAGFDYNFGVINANGGVRAEYNIQSVRTANDFEVINIDNPILSILPFLNLGYSITEKSILRLGYGRTINRPEFRELAPFLFYDYKLEAGRIGNPNLQTATIDNIDIRYEFYPRPGETISLGAFYKRFTNPIEDRTIITTEQPQFTYINADGAFNYGVELEVRKAFKGLTASSFIDKLSVNANASLIYSEVDLGAGAVAQDRVRALQGQSPYIVNGALYYQNNKHKLDISVIYNIYGPRIFSVGDVLFPTIYELQRHSLDLTMSKDLSDGVNLKVGIQDILNYRYRFYQDSDRNGIIDDKDDPVFTFQRGTLFNVSLTFDLLNKEKRQNKS